MGLVFHFTLTFNKHCFGFTSVQYTVYVAALMDKTKSLHWFRTINGVFFIYLLLGGYYTTHLRERSSSSQRAYINFQCDESLAKSVKIHQTQLLRHKYLYACVGVVVITETIRLFVVAIEYLRGWKWYVIFFRTDSVFMFNCSIYLSSNRWWWFFRTFSLGLLLPYSLDAVGLSLSLLFRTNEINKNESSSTWYSHPRNLCFSLS